MCIGLFWTIFTQTLYCIQLHISIQFLLNNSNTSLNYFSHNVDGHHWSLHVICHDCSKLRSLKCLTCRLHVQLHPWLHLFTAMIQVECPSYVLSQIKDHFILLRQVHAHSHRPFVVPPLEKCSYILHEVQDLRLVNLEVDDCGQGQEPQEQSNKSQVLQESPAACFCFVFIEALDAFPA